MSREFNEFDVEMIMDAVDTYVQAVETKVCREIDAGACQTQYDYMRVREAEDAADSARTELEGNLRRVLGIPEEADAAIR